MKRLARNERDQRDMALLARHAEPMNVEATTVLEDQIEL